MKLSTKILVACMFMHSFIPTMLCVTKAEQDFINAVTMGGNATNTGSRDLDAIKKAVAEGASVNTVFADYGNNTALHFAVDNQDMALINFLLKNKANINIQSKSGDTPAHVAANALPILEILVRTHPQCGGLISCEQPQGLPGRLVGSIATVRSQV